MDHQLSLSPFAGPTCHGKLLLTQRPAEATGLSTEGLECRVEGLGLRSGSSGCRDMQPHLALELERLASPQNNMKPPKEVNFSCCKGPLCSLGRGLEHSSLSTQL